MAKNNPVVETYKGIDIRKSNLIVFRLSAPFFKFLVLESERTGLSISKILSYSSKPCEKCAGIDVIVFNKSDEAVSIKRGILSRHNPENHGRNIIQQAVERNNKKPK